MQTPTEAPPIAIGELSRRSGFSIDTLRFYEHRGILPQPARTDAGRRRYDERSVDRLRFVARAKELGCTLEEIAALVSAWDDECAEVATPLGTMLDEKVLEARTRIEELAKLTVQLQATRARLAEGATPGPCGPDCACTPEVPHATGMSRPLTVFDPAITCTLDEASKDERLDDWQRALSPVERREPVDEGVRLVFGAGADVADVARLAAAEWACCSFLPVRDHSRRARVRAGGPRPRRGARRGRIGVRRSVVKAPRDAALLVAACAACCAMPIAAAAGIATAPVGIAIVGAAAAGTLAAESVRRRKRSPIRSPRGPNG
jgi:DNA-binding transcriptional MerR regulator